MSFGLPVEGEEGPFINEVVSEMLTVRWDRTIGQVRGQLQHLDDDQDHTEHGHDHEGHDHEGHDHEGHDHDHGSTARSGHPLAIVLGPGALAIGALDYEVLTHSSDSDMVVDVMRLVPSTIRPSVTVASLKGGANNQAIVTTSDGVLLGEADPDRAETDQLLAELEERFGTTEPSQEQLLAFLRERLIDDGRTPEEADQFLADMAAGGDEEE
ncbi:MAG: hypothetical protein ACRDZ8_07780 [Acidimicrobiales bacterium]